MRPGTMPALPHYFTSRFLYHILEHQAELDLCVLNK